MLIKFEPLFPI